MKGFNSSSYFLLILFTSSLISTIRSQNLPKCDALQLAQFECNKMEVNRDTGELVGCNVNNTVTQSCYPLDKVECNGDRNFTRQIQCFYTNGYSYSKTLGLSVFLGYFGVDRFYLGYPTIGLLKLMTFGGFLVGNWIDIILIATQTVGPADGSYYVVGLNGPRFTKISMSNSTYLIPEDKGY
eukprot:TRINITY_DN8820_c0_g1_i2.p1 TRINITY_DN8820_c0_g1~~TRINITY_DN8820_c0_g1_i2.p1  ORF type:complete len:193 (-),score=25.72 TRINITY_DN8820_c0_g1_i2:42-587(-)